MLILNGKSVPEGEYILRMYYDDTVGLVFEVDLLAAEAKEEPHPEAPPAEVESPSATGLDAEAMRQNVHSRFRVTDDILQQVTARSILRNEQQGKMNREFPFGTTPLRREAVKVSSGAYDVQDAECINQVVAEIVNAENKLQYDTEVATVGIIEELTFVLQGDENTFSLEEQLEVLKS